MATIGGGHIVKYYFNRAWGVQPAEASGVVVIDSSSGGSFSLGVGSYVVFSYGAVASAAGIITETGESVTTDGGTEYRFTLLDNRMRLNWAVVIGAFNIEDDRLGRRLQRAEAPDLYNNDSSDALADDDVNLGAGSSAPAAVPAVTLEGPVADNPLKRRRYKHLFPVHARAGIWTETDEPLSARQILNAAFTGAWGEYSFSRVYHSSMDSVFPMGVDVRNGETLSSFIARIIGQCGLDMKIEGTRTLHFDRKGEGLPHLKDGITGNRSSGSVINPNPSKVRVLGDPFRIQAHNISLEPDWVSGWEAWIDEAAWIRKVGEVFELPSETKADLAERSAFAREVSVARFLYQAELPDLADWRAYDQRSRMTIPAWTYIQNLVYRSYRIPDSFTMRGIPLRSLRLASGLLAGVEVVGTGASTAQKIKEENAELYPDARMHVMVKGQPLELIDARSISLFSQRRNKNLREQWIEWTECEIDERTWAVRFNGPMFIDGDPAEDKSIFSLVNQGKAGGVDVTAEVSEDSDYLDVVVPNPGFVITPAAVKLAVCFECGQYQQDFGSGPRRAVVSQQGIGMELIDVSGGEGGLTDYLEAPTPELLPFPSAGLSLKELKYADGEVAEDKAAAFADSIIQREAVQLSGGFVRYGAAGLSLSPTTDRVEVSVGVGGIEEKMDYTKARPTATFLAESTLVRLQRASESFEGQQALANEVRQLRLYAMIERLSMGGVGEKRGSYRSLGEVFSRPAGGEYQGTRQIYDKNEQAPESTSGSGDRGWKVGDLVWLDDAGYPSRTGKGFGGVLVVTPGEVEGVQSKDLSACTTGVVPVRISGVIPGGGVVMGTPGDPLGSATGERVIGELVHSGDTPTVEGGEVIAMVHLGFAASDGADQFRVSGVSYSEENGYECSVRWGYLFMRDAAAGEDADALVPYMPTLGGKLMNAADVEKLAFQAGDAVFLKVETDKRDAIKMEDPPDPLPDPYTPVAKASIVAAPQEQKSTHYQPADPENPEGVEGVYYYLIARFTIDEEDPAKVSIEQVMGDGPIIHTPNLRTIKNVGGGVGHFRRRDHENDAEEFRSSLGRHGVMANESGEEIWLNQNNESIGGGVPVWVHPKDGLGVEIANVEDYPQGPSKWRTFRGLFSGEIPEIATPQIHLELADGENSDENAKDTIRARGNGVVQSVSDAKRISISVIDGLVAALSAGSAEEEGGNLNLEIYIQQWSTITAVATVDFEGESTTDTDAVNFGTPPSSPDEILYWRDGRYVGSSGDEGGTFDPGVPAGGVKIAKVTYMQPAQ